MNKLLISGMCLLSFNSFADVTGTYEVKKGFARAMFVSESEQLGKFKLVMKGENNKKIKIKGLMLGVLNPTTFAISHTLVNQERTGTFITAGDSITNIFSGDPSCANGSVPFHMEETLIIVAGTGIYSEVEAGSHVIVNGVINNCPDLPNYLQNDFVVTGGTITFN